MRSLLFLIIPTLALFQAAAQEWKLAGDGMVSAWADAVDPEKPLPDYPRPQLVRQVWGNLNGLWDYAIVAKDAPKPESWEGKILVPYPVESALSGVGKSVGEDQRLWYRTSVFVPERWRSDRLLLHFGAVDWQTEVWLNGKPVGDHRGGYTPFHCDITEALQEGEEQEMVVAVWDPTDAGSQPRGKQREEPKGIWYTPVTGIWQTVWLEPVPQTAITKLRTVPDVDAKALRLTVHGEGPEATASTVRVQVLARREVVAEGTGTLGEEIQLNLAEPQLWSPTNPFIYTIRAHLLADDGGVVDSVVSYAGMRKISLGKDDQGVTRLFLNHEPLFMFGPLDQGWWPDGLYTAPTDSALRHDIEMTKQLGFNMARKHVKVEPARWYFWADVKGLLVWQDFPNGDQHIGREGEDLERSPESEAQFRQEYAEMIEALHNHPSIVVWVPFNEGWGQFKTDEILAWAKEQDPSRLIDGPSGWVDRGTGDLRDVHAYPGPATAPMEETRAVVLGEFGGLGLPVANHLWWDKQNWGYRTYEKAEDVWSHYQSLIRELFPLIKGGLAAAVYTQTTDVEGEVNGLMTYDRKRVKVDAEAMAALNRQVYGPLPTFERRVAVPTSEEAPQTWRYTTTSPEGDWSSAAYDDSAWSEGSAPFGEAAEGVTPGSVWDGEEIWLRRTFRLEELTASEWNHRLCHDEGLTLVINGVPCTIARQTSGYEDVPVSQAFAQALKTGENIVAIHARHSRGGRLLDWGLVDLRPTPTP